MREIQCSRRCAIGKRELFNISLYSKSPSIPLFERGKYFSSL
jgi:hypothetical protein